MKRLTSLLLGVLGLVISPTMHAATLTAVNEGVELHYRLLAVAGSATGPATSKPTPLVVLIHGWSCDGSFWEAQIEALRQEHDVLVLDLAGHGRSGDNRDNWSMRAFATDVVTVIATARSAVAKDAPIFLVGHSMGGPVAIEAARLLGDQVRAVIGVDTFKSIGLPPPSPADAAARKAVFERDFASTTRAFVTQSFFVPGTDPAFIEPIATKMAAARPRVGIAAIDGLNSWDGVTALRALGTLPIIAFNSAHGPPTNEAALRGYAPGFRAEVFEGVGHFLMMETPERFNARLLATLASLR